MLRDAIYQRDPEDLLDRETHDTLIFYRYEHFTGSLLRRSSTTWLVKSLERLHLQWKQSNFHFSLSSEKGGETCYSGVINIQTSDKHPPVKHPAATGEREKLQKVSFKTDELFSFSFPFLTLGQKSIFCPNVKKFHHSIIKTKTQ